MCNIAGYVGAREAAPILIDMIAKQEGLMGGFFTGLAVHNGTALHYRKLQGDLRCLLERTDAAKLKGCTGVIHSRTPSGGSGEWAHPFVTERDGEIKLCYVANGSVGAFENRSAEFNAIADRLIAEGYDIPCKIAYNGDRYSRLSTGEAVHMSDVMCQLIYQKKSLGIDTARAMEAAFCEMPSEIVGLTLEAESPDCIFFSRINMPMFVGFDESGAYLASSPMAFPESVTDYKLLPPLSSGRVYRNRYEVVEYAGFSMEVLPFDESTVAECACAVQVLLEKGGMSARELVRILKMGQPKTVLFQNAPILYLALIKLLEEHKITLQSIQCTEDGMTAPKTLFLLAEK